MLLGETLTQETSYQKRTAFFRQNFSRVVNIFANLDNCLPLNMNYKQYYFSIMFKCFNSRICNNAICCNDASTFIIIPSTTEEFFILKKTRLLYLDTSFMFICFPCQIDHEATSTRMRSQLLKNGPLQDLVPKDIVEQRNQHQHSPTFR